MTAKIRKLSSREIEKSCSKFPDWHCNRGQTELSKTFRFTSYVTALAFVARVVVYAEVLNHHPDIELTYGKVTITITTHEVKGLTKHDFELVKRIDYHQNT